MAPIYRHPKTTEEITERNALLQHCLRPENPIIPIVDEYPFHLSIKGAETSFCAFEDGKIIAHITLEIANLTAVSDRSIPIGLIGNVVTHPNFRGKGIMSALIKHAKDYAISRDAFVLALWTDLDKFYQTLGFVSLGRELRFHFRSMPNLSRSCRALNFNLIDRQSPPNGLVESLKALRFPILRAIDRSNERFNDYLRIPLTFPYVRTENEHIKAFGIVGKGYDLGGVIHEWGGQSPDDILKVVALAKVDLKFNDIIVLAPKNLNPLWKTAFNAAADDVTEHEMCLAAELKPGMLDRIRSDWFAWGFDSI